MPTPNNAAEVLSASVLGNAAATSNVEIIAGTAGKRIYVTKITISVGSAGANNVRLHAEDDAVASKSFEGGQFAANGGVANPYSPAIPLPLGKGLQADYSTANSTDIIVQYILGAR